MISAFPVDVGVFGETKRNTAEFCHNLFLAHAMATCTEQLQILENEYAKAMADGTDIEMIEQKRTELQTCQSSLTLAAYIMDVDDGQSA